jgi:hypothetical protein
MLQIIFLNKMILLIFTLVLILLIIWLRSNTNFRPDDWLRTKRIQTDPQDYTMPMSFPQASAELVQSGFSPQFILENKQSIESNIQTINTLNSQSLEIKKSDPNSNPPKYGITVASAYTTEEFKSNYLGLKLNPNYSGLVGSARLPNIDPTKIKPSVNLNTKPNPLPIYDQGACGCCWSVSASTVLNYNIFNKLGNTTFITNPLTYINCLTTDPQGKFSSQGCNGGDPMDVFNYVNQEKYTIGYQNNSGNLTCPFPGDSVNSKTCRPQTNCTFVSTATTDSPTNRKIIIEVTPTVIPLSTDRGTTGIPTKEEIMKLKFYLSTIGPLVICIDAGTKLREFSLYTGGFTEGPQGSLLPSGTQPDHAVVLVGYDKDKSGREYWIIQNSWKQTWGIQGLCHSPIDVTGITYPSTILV